MNSEAQEQSSALDFVKWLIVAGLVVSAIWGNQYYQGVMDVIRVAGVLGVLIVALLIAITTTKGKAAFSLVKDANIERKKVVWPTRQETVKTTMVVAVFVFIMALFLWFIDFLLKYAIGFLTGQ